MSRILDGRSTAIRKIPGMVDDGTSVGIGVIEKQNTVGNTTRCCKIKIRHRPFKYLQVIIHFLFTAAAFRCGILNYNAYGIGTNASDVIWCC